MDSIKWRKMLFIAMLPKVTVNSLGIHYRKFQEFETRIKGRYFLLSLWFRNKTIRVIFYQEEKTIKRHKIF